MRGVCGGSAIWRAPRLASSRPGISTFTSEASCKWRASWPTHTRRVHIGLQPGLSTLAIETSCDDTSVAILEIQEGKVAINGQPTLRSHVPFHRRITANTEAYNGIHPLVALHSHQSNLANLVAEALAAWSKDGSRKPTFVSVTRGPGMRSNLSVGLDTAKGLSLAWGVPLVGVHHMQAHALTPRLCSTLDDLPDLYQGPWTASTIQPTFPYLSVLASGGHTILVSSTGLTGHHILAITGDIAIGDCLDKAARAILPADLVKPPYGKALEDFAFPNGADDYNYAAPATRTEELVRRPSAWKWSLGPPMAESKSGEKTSRRMAFSFAGLLSSVERFMKFQLNDKGTPTSDVRPPESISVEERRDLAREVLRVSFEHLASRILLYLSDTKDTKVDTVVVSGGVASNRYLRHLLRTFLDIRGYRHIHVAFPPPSLCTDNALMIAWAGMEMYSAGYRSGLDILPIRKWSMDSHAEDGGILGVDGWTRNS